jgi:hypothetical protein
MVWRFFIYLIINYFILVTQVQIDTLEKFVSIIEYLIGNVENADILIKDYLFQSIVQTIGHGNNRIRKASQSSLARLFEFEQIKFDQIENDIIPSLCQLDRACDDFKNESILVCIHSYFIYQSFKDLLWKTWVVRCLFIYLHLIILSFQRMSLFISILIFVFLFLKENFFHKLVCVYVEWK